MDVQSLLAILQFWFLATPYIVLFGLNNCTGYCTSSYYKFKTDDVIVMIWPNIDSQMWYRVSHPYIHSFSSTPPAQLSGVILPDDSQKSALNWTSNYGGTKQYAKNNTQSDDLEVIAQL